ncbi:branched-chain amino acid ABC transporter substrate-binding protein [Microlunatus sp. GCM10028923]|uniref:branched-chain amino acid ABC transporter substrate-binding protein n=1 Tax=Microlunatus sp. GCM10028923 TaxID=3273400 RepID=UPI00360A0FC6
MLNRRLAKVGVATLVAAALALTGCGQRGGDGNTGGGGGTEEKKIAKIGVISPMSGGLSALGLGIQNSVDLAIKQANANNEIPGWTLEIEVKDDEAKSDVGLNAATSLASDPEVVGVVGTLNTSVAQGVQPVLNGKKIAMVSPANTGPALTRGEDYANSPKRLYPNYFRTCATDDVQGPFAAKYLFNTAKFTKVATVNDKKAYGAGLVKTFSDAFTELGGQVTAAETINPDDKDYSAVITKIKATNPQALYYGGEYPQAGPLSQQMKAAGLNIPLMGGDGIFDPDFIKQAGSKSDGDLATSVGAPVEKLPTSKTFVADYEAAGYSDPYAAYGPYAYDAARAIIEGLKVSLKDAESAEAARQATIDAIGKVSFDGATGKVAFDEYGDATTKILTVYKVTDQKWAAVETGS